MAVLTSAPHRRHLRAAGCLHVVAGSPRVSKREQGASGHVFHDLTSEVTPPHTVLLVAWTNADALDRQEPPWTLAYLPQPCWKHLNEV